MTESVFVRMEPELRRALEAWAEEHERALSYVLRLAAVEFLARRGLLPASIKAPKEAEAE